MVGPAGSMNEADSTSAQKSDALQGKADPQFVDTLPLEGY